MSKHRPHKYAKSDKNQAEIVADLRKLGYDVDVVSGLRGLYDLVVSGKFHYVQGDLDHYQMEKDCSVRVEIKSEKGKLNETEQKYYDGLKHKGSYIVARCTEDVVDWFGNSIH